MGNISSRKEERARIVAILESDEYESADAMATVLIKEVHRIFEERDWYALAWKPGTEPKAEDFPDPENLPEGLSLGSPALCWGPFSSATEATRFGKSLAVGGIARPVKLYSVQGMLDTIVKGVKGKEKFCHNCGHPVGTHLHERQMGNCQVRGCKCKSMTKKEAT